MKRREFLKSSAVAAGALALGGALHAETRQPNILLIEIDQMRYPRWTPDARLPNYERLVKSGVNFAKHFTSAVPCSPSRACLFTGTYTTQNGMLSNCDFVEGNLQPSLSPKIPNLGNLFRKAGYRTPYRGKWHLTRKADRNPKDALIDYGWEGWKPPEALFGGAPYNGELVDPVYAKEAAAWLSQSSRKSQPWILVCNLINPHDICAYPRYYPNEKLKAIKTKEPPANWTDDLSTKPRVQLEYQKRYEKIGGPIGVNSADAWRRYLDYYIECEEMVDKQIGRVLDALEKSGQKENTIIVFTADHGEMGGSHKLRTKGNFAYEEVMNVPLIFCWPGRLPAGVVTEAMASNVDVMPTLAALAGISNGSYMAGKDLSPILRNPATAEARDHVLYHTDWEIELTVNKSANDNAIYRNSSHVRALRDKEWKYAYYFSPKKGNEEHELYNLKDDPLEMTNLASDSGYQKKMKEMHDRLMEQEDQLTKEFAHR
jgi:arylsulfatase A-like enzyme